METANIAREIASLPPEARKEVVDFVAFLKGRYPTKRIKMKILFRPLGQSNFGKNVPPFVPNF